MPKNTTLKKTKGLPVTSVESPATVSNDAKMLFTISSLEMGWQLALAVLIPIFFGSWLDNRFHKYPVWTIIGLIVALLGFYAIVRKTVININHKQSKKDKS
ncbi:MAG: AtpZ/AtpI family protein [Candidatus Saccharibacteria bacterium]